MNFRVNVCIKVVGGGGCSKNVLSKCGEIRNWKLFVRRNRENDTTKNQKKLLNGFHGS